MAMFALLFLVLSFVGLLLGANVHAVLGGAFVVAAFLHNHKSRAFYGKVLSGQSTGRRKGDLAMIVFIGVATVVTAISGALMLACVMTPWFLTPWLWMHRVGAAALVVLSVLHMRQEWS